MSNFKQYFLKEVVNKVKIRTYYVSMDAYVEFINMNNLNNLNGRYVKIGSLQELVNLITDGVLNVSSPKDYDEFGTFDWFWTFLVHIWKCYIDQLELTKKEQAVVDQFANKVNSGECIGFSKNVKKRTKWKSIILKFFMLYLGPHNDKLKDEYKLMCKSKLKPLVTARLLIVRDDSCVMSRIKDGFFFRT